ncbi:MAG: murein biosynthesis integral membrane protein MurJ [Gammaproteobacteria bacterium]
MTRSLFKSVSVVSGMTLLSRILGFTRDILFAYVGGASAFMAAFLVAFKIPNFLRRLFAEGAFSQAFVPVLSEYKEKHTHDETRALVDRAALLLGGAVFVLTVVGVVAAPVFVIVFAPGFWMDADAGTYALAVEMLRWTFPYILFISLTALAAGILNTWGRFAPSAFTPVLLNLVLIAATLWLAPRFENPGLGLAIGVLIAGILQLAFQVPFLMKLRLMPRPWRRTGDIAAAREGVRRIGRLMLPAVFGSSVAQVNLLLDTIIASFLVAGSIPWLYYSDRLMEFPLGVFGIALATVVLPRLSGQHATASREAFAATLDWSLRWVWLIILPAAVGLFTLAGPLLATLFERGAFTAGDTTMARLSLMAYAFGILGFALVKVLAPGFYARQDMRTPVRIGIIALCANMALNVLFVVPWVWSGLPGAHAGLALATSVAAFINAGLLYLGLKRAGVLWMRPGWWPFLVRVVVATAVMGVVVAWFAGPLMDWHALETMGRALRLAGVIGAGIVVYALALAALGVRPQALRIALP